MMKIIFSLGITTALLAVLTLVTSVCGNELYFIDAHSQVDHKVVPLLKIISIMKQSGVSHTILSARGKLKGKDLLAFTAEYSEYVTPAARTKGKTYETGSVKYYETLKRQVASGRYSAMAEVLLYHAQKGSKAPEYIVYPEDDRVQAPLKYAVNNHWPFVVHIEFGSLNGEKRKRFIESLQSMIEQYPEHAFVLTHVGQLEAAECLRLIKIHANLHFHTGWTNPVAVKGSNQPWINIFKGEVLAPEWHDLFVQYPERFVFALDNVFAEHWSIRFYSKQMELWKKALVKLPLQVAHLIAHGNAERLWHLAPKR